MIVTKNKIREWCARGQSKNKRYMIIASDDFSHEYYPVFAFKDELGSKLEYLRSQRMISIKEIYDLSEPITHQVNSKKAWVKT